MDWLVVEKSIGTQINPSEFAQKLKEANQGNKNFDKNSLKRPKI